jgi:hypothetical protein
LSSGFVSSEHLLRASYSLPSPPPTATGQLPVYLPSLILLSSSWLLLASCFSSRKCWHISRGVSYIGSLSGPGSKDMSHLPLQAGQEHLVPQLGSLCYIDRSEPKAKNLPSLSSFFSSFKLRMRCYSSNGLGFG